MNNNQERILILFLIILNILIYYAIFYYFNIKSEILFLPVGEGDSELIRTRSGNVLIDAGPRQNVLVPLSQSISLVDKTIDIVLITHPDADHFQGLIKILDYYKVRLVILNNFSLANGNYVELLTRLYKLKIPVVLGIEGTKIDLNDGIKLSLLYPNISDLKKIKVTNEMSVISLLEMNNKKILFTGDITAKLLEKTVSKYLTGDIIDVLKVPHHGAKNTLSENIFKTISVKKAIIEVGKNNYGHPTDFIINLLDDFEIPYMRTDLDGVIEFR
jgi:competence protein ComEC